MKIVCPACNNPIAGQDIDLADGRALCRPCGEVVTFGANASTALATTQAITDALMTYGDTQTPPPALTRFRPADLKIVETQDDKNWVFDLKPNRLMAVPLLGFAAIWNAFLIVWYSIAFASHGGPFNLMVWFPILHVGAGLYITYQGLVKLFNRTRIELGPSTFKITQSPIPGRKVRELTGNLLRFEPAVKIASTINTRNRYNSTPQWQIKLLTDDGRSIELPLDLPKSDHAGYVANRLNHALEENRAPTTYRG